MASQSVAEIVADTMNNYLLMGHLLKVNVSYSATWIDWYWQLAHSPRPGPPRTLGGSQQEVPSIPPSTSREGEAGEGKSILWSCGNQLIISQGQRNRRKLQTSESRLTRERGGRRLRMLVLITSLRDMLKESWNVVWIDWSWIWWYAFSFGFDLI